MPDDQYGQPVSGIVKSVEAWDLAWGDALHYVGEPFDRLAEPNEHDESFALGSVFCGAYRILGGAPLDSELVQDDLDRATRRANSPRDYAHVEALRLLTAGDFTDAAKRWDQAASDVGDMAAVRFAHDTYLHVGDADRRLASSSNAVGVFQGAPAGEPFVLGQYSFALEEAGHYDEAQRVGWLSLHADPMDLWALHALAHVFESTNAQEEAMNLFDSRRETWTKQGALAVHIHWHQALRMLAVGDFDNALQLHDDLVDEATTAFRLCDLASLLWRLELLGVEVGSRWEHLAAAFSERPERHTSGFLDLHMAMAFARCPTHPDAETFFRGVAASHRDDNSENGETFRTVVVPLTTAIRLSMSEPGLACELLTSCSDTQHRIGGSIAQRDLITLTQKALVAS